VESVVTFWDTGAAVAIEARRKAATFRLNDVEAILGNLLVDR
jgi:hypothetical protein